jgi:hypothetical protein
LGIGGPAIDPYVSKPSTDRHDVSIVACQIDIMIHHVDSVDSSDGQNLGLAMGFSNLGMALALEWARIIPAHE